MKGVGVGQHLHIMDDVTFPHRNVKCFAQFTVKQTSKITTNLGHHWMLDLPFNGKDQSKIQYYAFPLSQRIQLPVLIYMQLILEASTHYLKSWR